MAKNNFDLLRLVLAGVVCLIHAYQLSGFEQLSIFSKFLSSDLAVKAFFIVSGFLIFMSYERSSSLRSYAEKRIRRIYPAYFTVIVLCAFLLVFLSNKSVSEYFSLAWLKYVAVNLIFLNTLQPTLPGVFEANIIPAVDGALWTLKIEAMFYVAVPLFALCFRKFGRLKVMAVIYILSIIYSFSMALLTARTGSRIYVELARQLPGQLSYFMAGASLYYYLPLFERKLGVFLVAAVAVVVLNYFIDVAALFPLALAVIVIFFGLFCYAGNFGKYGDFSYGAYILHFPIIQILLSLGVFVGHPWAFLATVILLTAIGAFAMWNLVESRFLHRRSTVQHGASHSKERDATSSNAPPVR